MGCDGAGVGASDGFRVATWNWSEDASTVMGIPTPALREAANVGDTMTAAISCGKVSGDDVGHGDVEMATTTSNDTAHE